jgi:uncharacterized protein (DUF433 family)
LTSSFSLEIYEASFKIMTTIALVDIGAFISSSPNIRNGRPLIDGTGVTVQRVVGWYKLGRTPEEIVETFGHLTLAQVYAALAYYHANQEIIDAQMSADENEAALLAQSN